MNTSTKVSLSQKRWFRAGANTVLMASMLFFVQVSSGGGEFSEAYISVHKTSYLSHPDFEEKRLLSTEVNPALTEFIAELEDPSVKKSGDFQGSKPNDLTKSLKEMEDLELRMTIHYADPHFDPRANKRRMAKLRSQLKAMSSDLDPDQLFKIPVHDIK